LRETEEDKGKLEWSDDREVPLVLLCCGGEIKVLGSGLSSMDGSCTKLAVDKPPSLKYPFEGLNSSLNDSASESSSSGEYRLSEKGIEVALCCCLAAIRKRRREELP